MQTLAIIVFCVIAACGYGIIHDQITARICIEYFTVAHPPIFNHPVNSPTVLAFAWGIIATWWVGLGLGIPLAFAARFGDRPKQSVREVAGPIVLLLCVMALLAFLAGVTGALLASAGGVTLTGLLSDNVSPDHHVAFLADAFAHSMSYLAGAVGGIVLIVKTWRERATRLELDLPQNEVATHKCDPPPGRRTRKK
jgi:H+/Cl- antiporter ClcA